jgi:hypothetical protein
MDQAVSLVVYMKADLKLSIALGGNVCYLNVIHNETEAQRRVKGLA